MQDSNYKTWLLMSERVMLKLLTISTFFAISSFNAANTDGFRVGMIFISKMPHSNNWT